MIPILTVITVIIITIAGAWNYIANNNTEKISSILCIIIVSVCLGILINYEVPIIPSKSIDANQKQALDTLKINVDSINIKQDKINHQYYPIYIPKSSTLIILQ